MNRSLSRAASRAFAAFLFSATLFAQDAPVVRPGDVEVAGFVGTTFGLDKVRVPFGGNVAVAVNRWLMPYGEFSYFPRFAFTAREETSQSAGTTTRFRYSLGLADYHGGVHIRLPRGESRFVPYGAFGVGVVRTLDRKEEVEISGGGLPTVVTSVDVPARTDFAINFGGGFRYYVNEVFGVRLEAKGYRSDATANQVFGKVTFGVFFQIK
jgi:hypothetical protein